MLFWPMMNLLGGHHTEKADNSQALSQHESQAVNLQVAVFLRTSLRVSKIKNALDSGGKQNYLHDLCLPVHRTVSLGLQNW